MIQANEWVSQIAVCFIGIVAVGILVLMALHRDSILPLSGPFGVCIGALAAIVQSHPKQAPTGVSTDSVETVNVQPPGDAA
jgi:hypothetical protein